MKIILCHYCFLSASLKQFFLTVCVINLHLGVGITHTSDKYVCIRVSHRNFPETLYGDTDEYVDLNINALQRKHTG